MAPKVDFMLIGAQKSATTTLFDLLKKHPALCACKDKEPEFFSHGENWKDQIEAYEALFDKKEGQLAFEASTSYTAHPTYGKEVWKNLYDYNPDLKFIYILRHPIDRIISAHRFLYRRGYAKTRNINDFLKPGNYHVNLSRYHYQIKPFIDLFGEDKVKIVLFDEFSDNPQNIVREILDFLGIGEVQNFKVETLKSNTKEKELQMVTGFGYMANMFLKVEKKLPYRLSRFLRRKLLYREIKESDLKLSRKSLDLLKQELLPDIEAMEKLLDKDLSHWKTYFN